MTTTKQVTTTTLMRVKRRRDQAPLSTLTFETHAAPPPIRKRSRKNEQDDEVVLLSQLMHQSTYIAKQHETKIPPSVNTNKAAKSTKSVLWKRISGSPDSVQVLASTKRKTNESVRLVDVLLEDEGSNEIVAEEGEPASKRRRVALTIVDSTTVNHSEQLQASAKSGIQSKCHTNNMVLDPLSRIVHQSMNSVLEGNKSIEQHLQLLREDVNLKSRPPTTLLDKNAPHSWFQWTLPQGSLLHLAALQNDVIGAQQILALGIIATDIRDADGNSALQVARLAGHDQIVKLLEEVHADDDDSDAEYVYDVYEMEKVTQHSPLETKIATSEEDIAPTAELRGGIGYWSATGELILEVDTLDKDDDVSLDEEDSNDEGHIANDYPDEWINSDDESEENEDYYSFRNAPMMSDYISDHYLQDEDVDDDYRGVFTGLTQSRIIPERQFAYDAEHEYDSGEG